MKPRRAMHHKAHPAPHVVRRKPADNTVLIAGVACVIVIIVALLFWLTPSQPQPAATPTPYAYTPAWTPTPAPTATPTPVPTIIVVETPTATPTPVPTEGVPLPTVQPVGAPCNNDMDCAQGWCDKTRQTHEGFWGTCILPGQ
ncbi:MAG: hypothetical protein AB1626_01025 [Candidatus Micrarchaeota archaeon]